MRKGLERVKKALKNNSGPWILGFSGGKDSTAVLALLLTAAKSYRGPQRSITVVYCDTGVEIPPSKRMALQLLDAVRLADNSRLKIVTEIARPAAHNTFFSRVIGRGYPPPTAMFRWCTDKLRIEPVDQVMRRVASSEKCLLVLGVRFGESAARDRTMGAHSSRTLGDGYFRSSNKHATFNFCPIYDYSVNEVWETIIQSESLLGMQASKLLGLYRAASGECPLIADPKMPPCGSARFGCWTCSVVQRDRTTTSLVEEGFSELRPMLEFRNWLVSIRSDPARRWPVRRNGSPGLGPFRIATRKTILNRLLAVEEVVGTALVSDEEIREIYRLWLLDLESRGAAA